MFLRLVFHFGSLKNVIKWAPPHRKSTFPVSFWMVSSRKKHRSMFKMHEKTWNKMILTFSKPCDATFEQLLRSMFPYFPRFFILFSQVPFVQAPFTGLQVYNLRSISAPYKRFDKCHKMGPRASRIYFSGIILGGFVRKKHFFPDVDACQKHQFWSMFAGFQHKLKLYLSKNMGFDQNGRRHQLSLEKICILVWENSILEAWPPISWTCSFLFFWECMFHVNN